MFSRAIRPRLVPLLALAIPAMAARPSAALSASDASNARISGTASYRERIALTPGAVFEAVLQDVSRADAPAEVIARARKVNPGQVPIAFEISFDRGRIDPRRKYVVRATIHEDGRLRFSSDRAYPVLTQGHGDKVAILMRIVPGAVSDSTSVAPTEPRVDRTGMFRYMADAARFRDCRSGLSLPVATSGDYLALERAYTARAKPGQELLVSLAGRIEQRQRMEGEGTEPTLVVEEFVRVLPGEKCEERGPEFGIEHDRWRPVRIGDQAVTVPEGEREPWIVLEPRSKRVTGSGGCNRISGGYEAGADTLRFGPLAATTMACPSRETETAFLRAL